MFTWRRFTQYPCRTFRFCKLDLKKLFFGGGRSGDGDGGGEGGAQQKCQPPWLTGDKNIKITLARTPQNSPKKITFGPENKWSKLHSWSLSIDFRFSNRKNQSQQKIAKKIIHFNIQFRS